MTDRLPSVVVPLLAALVLLSGCGERIEESRELPAPGLPEAEALLGLEFTPRERALMREDLAEQRAAYLDLRSRTPANDVAPPLVFDPRPAGFRLTIPDLPPRWSVVAAPPRPADLEDLAFATVGELSALLRSRRVTSLELTEMFLGRLERYGPELACVVATTPQLAREQARRADREIAAGRWRGPLHGVPYGVKDLLAVRGTRTTWGAEPYREQSLDVTATVVAKLEAQGAVLCAKLTLGALAMGDHWFGGQTRNPWDLEQGSSGSSAGPASAVAAGLLPFAIGSETWGSIVSPSMRCGVTGLRPTFGRVSRDGAMALSWSMDKLGPMARCAEDCALVFEAIRGADGRDPSVIEAPFPYAPRADLRGLRVGFAPAAFDTAGDREDPGLALDRAALAALRALGAELVPVAMPKSDAMPLSVILTAEAAAAFEELTLSGRDDLLSQQGRGAWPNIFRAARLIPAVEYLQANRLRAQLMAEVDRMFAGIDLYVGPSFAGQDLLVFNLTGHPSVVVPDGFDGEGHPRAWCFVGRLFDEATVLAAARAWQEATGWHRAHPPRYAGSPAQAVAAH
ncbi:MAG: amidase [Candidatus Latescibacteria bacterium]|nr:amidase [Candidatus Latescibacterota bacterium]